LWRSHPYGAEAFNRRGFSLTTGDDFEGDLPERLTLMLSSGGKPTTNYPQNSQTAAVGLNYS